MKSGVPSLCIWRTERDLKGTIRALITEKIGNIFYWTKQVQSILKQMGQEIIIAYFLLRNTNQRILDRKDGRGILQ